MKNTPNSIITSLTSDLAEPYLIVDMEFSSNTVRLTNLPYNITVSGNTYVSDGGLTKLAPPQLTAIADREVYRIELVDYSNEYQSYFDSGAIGTAVTVRLGIEGNTSDFDIVYKGRIDGATIETNPGENSKNALIECSSPFGALDRTTERLTDSATQKNINITDTCFDNIYNNTDETSLRWGKKP